ncbi:pentapeptide repeat-containing protein [Gloeocapsa sp. PCC 73106]|uniref:pentapeptide repeat-containing protein n=1 Tax=Gloeocapsa sp. PCC 73106 TaxID=102232 RepID=UPI0002ABA024|nr:pentapeptide repeat-containing protein [Gloeocapsa sp. PCC 73106]ELR98570.1 putative low-complexity protein [Gloeocapsa sp. PCC 73106]
MLKDNAELEIRKRYSSGDRQFQNIKLRHAQLKGIKLTQANLKGADLSYANLRGADLSYADLSNAYLNETNLIDANLRGAILNRASLIKALLANADLTNANLTEAYLTKAFLTNVNLIKANLSGTYLHDADLTGTKFTEAVYTPQTQFPLLFNPRVAGMTQKSSLDSLIQQRITVAQLLTGFNEVAQCSNHYLGNTLTAKYLQSSRPQRDWLSNFTVNSQGEITFDGPINTQVTTLQLQYFQEWIAAFIKACSLIIQDFGKVIKNQKNDLVNTILSS